MNRNTDASAHSAGAAYSKLMRKMSRVRMATLFLFVLFGGGTFLYSTYELVQGAAAESWPSVEGKIAISSSRTGKGSSGFGIRYTYSVGEKEYSSKRVSYGYGEHSGSEEHALAAVNRYPSGSAVQVFYDPEDPSRAVLEPGQGFGSWVGLTTGAVFCFGAILAGLLHSGKVRLKLPF